MSEVIDQLEAGVEVVIVKDRDGDTMLQTGISRVFVRTIYYGAVGWYSILPYIILPMCPAIHRAIKCLHRKHRMGCDFFGL